MHDTFVPMEVGGAQFLTPCIVCFQPQATSDWGFAQLPSNSARCDQPTWQQQHN